MIPGFQTIMLPFLERVSDKQQHSLREIIEHLANIFELTDEERKELLPSGQQTVFDNRVGWARTYLKKALLIEATKRGYFQITERGVELLKENPTHIDNAFLRRYSEFNEFKNARKDYSDNGEASTDDLMDEKTPEETLEYSYQKIRRDLATDLLSKVKSCSSRFFENLVVELLVAMGYGGSKKDAGQAVGKSGDGGIDGIIKEDKLGLDVIYIQAKKWEGSVGRPEIQKFVGALQGHRARKGVFITSSHFTRDAIDYVTKIESKIVLVDGEQLANLMIDYNLGVSKITAYEVKKIDSDYFMDE